MIILNIYYPLMKKKELVDLATISDQEINNDDIVYMLLTKENGVGWEELQVEVFNNFNSEDDNQSAMSTNR